MTENDSRLKQKSAQKGGRNFVIYALVAIVWLAADVLTKQHFDGKYSPGDVISDSFFGIFQFRLVHNTGAAWGLFGDSTSLLGMLSLVVCVVIFGYFIYVRKHASMGETLGLALVLAGGIGNAIDRFTLGYVVDFIEFSFIDFPVFNIADIGVTCGFALVLISMIIKWRHEDNVAANTDKVPEETPSA